MIIFLLFRRGPSIEYYKKIKNFTFFVIVSWMRNTAKDVKTEIDNTRRFLCGAIFNN